MTTPFYTQRWFWLIPLAVLAAVIIGLGLRG